MPKRFMPNPPRYRTLPLSPEFQRRLRILETPLATWEPPEYLGPTPVEKWMDALEGMRYLRLEVAQNL